MAEIIVKPPPGEFVPRIWKLVISWLKIILQYALSPYTIYRELFKKAYKFKEFPNRSGEVVVLTGGTRGIGLGVLKRLLKCNFRVILGSRSLIAGEEIVNQIRSSGVSTGSTKVFELDLKSLKSVKRFAENVLRDSPRIDVLINNAGVMFPPYEVTEDGFESQFQVNYLSHFLLTNLLLPRIKETSAKRETVCRIVNVSSDANYGADIDFNDLEICKVYSSAKSYSDSKLCQVIHAKYLDKLLRTEQAKVNVYSLHPGIIPSDLWVNCGQLLLTCLSFVKFVFKTPEDGADVVLYTVLSPDLEGVGGVFINNCEVVEPHVQASDVALQKQMWDKSIQWTKIS